MRSITLTSFGGLDALELVDMPEPDPGEGEEVVEVRAVALGRWDLLAPGGWFVELGGWGEFPQVQGWDFAGETAGGRRVLGFVAQPWMKVGALAERIAVPSAVLAELPDGLDWAAGSALPVCALTARQLLDTAGVESGDLVLITGAAGMVGGFAVQLARGRGARVIGAVRTPDAQEARRLGAEATVDSGEPCRPSCAGCGAPARTRAWTQWVWPRRGGACGTAARSSRRRPRRYPARRAASPRRRWRYGPTPGRCTNWPVVPRPGS
jgi:NADPH:quinone reductase-like Zn-dependent oxidoreductase